MKRISILLGAGAAAVALFGVPAGATVPRGEAALRVSSCHHAVAPFERRLGIAARMRAFPGTARMAVRLDLLVHRRGEVGYQPIGGKDLGFGVWLKSDPGVGRYRYIRKVRSLDVPATYRMRVSFRWYDAHGKVLLTKKRLTRACFQPDLRPDLRIRFARVKRSGPIRDAYAISVRNAGATAAGPFALTLAFPAPVGGVPTSQRWTIDLLGPGEVTNRTLPRAPKCSAGAPTATVDPDLAVVESDETNNSRVVVCPVP
jgi:CARDB protein